MKHEKDIWPIEDLKALEAAQNAMLFDERFKKFFQEEQRLEWRQEQENRRHIYKYELDANAKEGATIDFVDSYIMKQTLKTAIASLTETQKCRITMHFYEGYLLTDIAAREKKAWLQSPHQ